MPDFPSLSARLSDIQVRWGDERKDSEGKTTTFNQQIAETAHTRGKNGVMYNAENIKKITVNDGQLEFYLFRNMDWT